MFEKKSCKNFKILLMISKEQKEFEEWMEKNNLDIYDIKDMIKLLPNGEYNNKDFFELYYGI